MEELDQLKKKLQKDIADSAHRIGSVQKEIQELVHERKEKRKQWEDSDAELEGSILELTNEVAGILQRQLMAEELIKSFN